MEVLRSAFVAKGLGCQRSAGRSPYLIEPTNWMTGMKFKNDPVAAVVSVVAIMLPIGPALPMVSSIAPAFQVAGSLPTNFPQLPNGDASRTAAPPLAMHLKSRR